MQTTTVPTLPSIKFLLESSVEMFNGVNGGKWKSLFYLSLFSFFLSFFFLIGLFYNVSQYGKWFWRFFSLKGVIGNFLGFYYLDNKIFLTFDGKKFGKQELEKDLPLRSQMTINKIFEMFVIKVYTKKVKRQKSRRKKEKIIFSIDNSLWKKIFRKIKTWYEIPGYHSINNINNINNRKCCGNFSSPILKRSSTFNDINDILIQVMCVVMEFLSSICKHRLPNLNNPNMRNFYLYGFLR